MGTMQPFYRVTTPTMTPYARGPAFSLPQLAPFTVSLQTILAIQGQIESEAVRAFAHAAQHPITRIFYSGDDLTSVQYRNAADVLVYTATYIYTGDDLTRIELVRASDSETWSRIFSYTGEDLTEVETA